MEHQRMKVVKLGLIDYTKAYEIQLKVHQKVNEGKWGNVFLLLEHPPVITTGLSGNRENINATGEQLNEARIQIRSCRRGGDVTYHGPGQIVGYPIFNLRYIGRKIRQYITNLENANISLLKNEYAIEAGRKPEFPGVWIGDEKITAIGCRVKRGISLHGFAFNINTNLEHFKYITPCGLVGKGVTSLKRELGQSQDFEKNVDLTIKYLARTFGFDYTTINKAEFLNDLEEE